MNKELTYHEGQIIYKIHDLESGHMFEEDFKTKESAQLKITELHLFLHGILDDKKRYVIEEYELVKQYFKNKL